MAKTKTTTKPLNVPAQITPEEAAAIEARMIERRRTMADEDGAEALKRAREALERAVEEIKRYEARYADTRTETFGATSPMHAKADVLGWAIGYIASSILGNARLDLLADAKAKLAIEAHREYQAAK